MSKHIPCYKCPKQWSSWADGCSCLLRAPGLQDQWALDIPTLHDSCTTWLSRLAHLVCNVKEAACTILFTCLLLIPSSRLQQPVTSAWTLRYAKKSSAKSHEPECTFDLVYAFKWLYDKPKPLLLRSLKFVAWQMETVTSTAWRIIHSCHCHDHGMSRPANMEGKNT